jgi:hypothetical protein
MTQSIKIPRSEDSPVLTPSPLLAGHCCTVSLVLGRAHLAPAWAEFGTPTAHDSAPDLGGSHGDVVMASIVSLSGIGTGLYDGVPQYAAPPLS